MTGRVLEFQPVVKTADALSLQTKVEVYQRLFREWMPHITGNEIAVLGSIIDRTIGWGRREAYWTTRAMLMGDAIYGGLDMGRATLFRCLASLEAKGLIARRASASVPDRTHYSVNLNWKPDMVAIPKRLQGRLTPSHDETTPSQIDTTSSHGETLYTVSTQDHLNGSLAGTATVHPAGKVRAKAEQTAAASKTRAAEKRMFGEKSQATCAAVEQTWRMALTEVFPGNAERAWGFREKGQVNTAAKNWLGARTVTFTEFVDWAVRNWTAIMRKQFKWMTKSPPPTVPALSFFIYNVSGFAECHAENKLEDWLSAADRTELERMMGRGQTYEQAMQTLAENKTAKAMRGEIEERERNASIQERTADLTLQRAKKLADMGGAPIHPRSPAARKRLAEAAGQKPTTIDIPLEEIGKGVSVYFVPEENPFD